MQLTNNDSLRRSISDEMERQGLTANGIAPEVGCTRQTLKNFLSGTTDGLSSTTLLLLMERLGYFILTPGDVANVKALLSDANILALSDILRTFGVPKR